MLQAHVPDLAGRLARRLCGLAAGAPRRPLSFRLLRQRRRRSGHQVLPRHHRTRRTSLCDGAFHGLTCGALSLMSEPFWRGKFGPMLPNTACIPFGDIAALQREAQDQKLRRVHRRADAVRRRHSSLRRELPEEAQELCRKYGTLFVLDEVQTGMFRTGISCRSSFRRRPRHGHPRQGPQAEDSSRERRADDRRRLQSVYDSLKRSIVHTSTFGENRCRCAPGSRLSTCW